MGFVEWLVKDLDIVKALRHNLEADGKRIKYLEEQNYRLINSPESIVLEHIKNEKHLESIIMDLCNELEHKNNLLVIKNNNDLEEYKKFLQWRNK